MVGTEGIGIFTSLFVSNVVLLTGLFHVCTFKFTLAFLTIFTMKMRSEKTCRKPIISDVKTLK